ncbi:conserved membrane protein [Clostridium tetani E88]|uniref:Conserved membrane protein n=2 Tax=Clostridium tetani TaxID=1513 RepID=Q898P6_CLOTE|nr:conserved membrane protein [Clostridium tetani E88]
MGSIYPKINRKIGTNRMESIKKYLKRPCPYWVAGILLGLMNVILLGTIRISWQITSGFLLWGIGILQWFGLEPLNWEYFKYFKSYYQPVILYENVFINQYTILNLGVLIGSLIATLLVSQFKWKRIKSKKQFIMALIGGVMMGYGTRLAVGCNIGAFFSGIPSFSLHAWIFGVFAMLGTWVGVKILTKYFI